MNEKDKQLVNSGLSFSIYIKIGTNIQTSSFRVQFNGNVFAAGTFSPSGADYAEMFEWQDGNPVSEDRRGYFVTLENEYIRKATDADNYILGVVSGDPSIAANAQGCGWKGMYLRDEFGAVIYEWIDQQREVPNDDPAAMEAWREACMKACAEARRETRRIRTAKDAFKDRNNSGSAA